MVHDTVPKMPRSEGGTPFSVVESSLGDWSWSDAVLALLSAAGFLQITRLDFRFCVTMLSGIGRLAERMRPGDKTLGVTRMDALLPLEHTPRLCQQE